MNSMLRDLVLITCVCVATMSAASAAVRAQVDRPSVDLNESFMLEVIVDTNTDLEPDLTVLEEDFYVGQVSQLSNTSIYNGEIRRSRTWTIALMPKSTGTQEIPPISIGNEQSAPVRIIVNEPSNAPPGEADVFVTSEIDSAETYVQAQILYRIKVYRAVATRQPALREPTISGAEVLVELAGDERSYESILNGKAYNVVERVIAIYPQESGEISISPARFEARVLRGGRITGRKVFESDSHTVKVLPIPALPDDFPNAAWLPARDVQLSEEWSRDPDRINAGEPVTRRVTISALGQIETQIPAIEPPEIDGLNIYDDKPELSRRIEAGGIRGVRKDQYAMIGVNGGAIELPELKVPWWNIDAGEWRIATLPARTITVKAAEEPVFVPPVTATTPEADVTEAVDFKLMPAGFWERVSQLLAAAWLLTIFAWWWSSRDRKREPRAPELPPIYKRQAKLVRAARKAALAGNDAALRVAMLEWGRLQWPDNAPRSVGALAERVSSPLADELNRLSRASYGRGASDWDGAALAKALRSIVVLREHAEAGHHEALPPLMPPAV
ncbi:MAG: BatD family protein [Woeseiaceae bacterium]